MLNSNTSKLTLERDYLAWAVTVTILLALLICAVIVIYMMIKHFTLLLKQFRTKFSLSDLMLNKLFNKLYSTYCNLSHPLATFGLLSAELKQALEQFGD